MSFSGNQIDHSLGVLLKLLLQGPRPTTNLLSNLLSQVSIFRSLSGLFDDVKIVNFKFPWVISLDTQVVKGNATHYDRFGVRSSTISFVVVTPPSVLEGIICMLRDNPSTSQLCVKVLSLCIFCTIWKCFN